jgi:alkanesulfonate monooxygenase SsuD/methylene tetrahydromethanopterin reductase-like flavin-dependent oxidoreductase (luciferase family)
VKVDELARVAREAGRRRPHDVAGLMPLAMPDHEPAPDEAQPLVGPPDTVIDTLRRYQAAGLDHVILSPYYGVPATLLPKSIADVLRLLERFIREVRPQV